MGRQSLSQKKCYIVVLNKFWRALWTRRDINWDEQWLQKNGATPDRTRIMTERLEHQQNQPPEAEEHMRVTASAPIPWPADQQVRGISLASAFAWSVSPRFLFMGFTEGSFVWESSQSIAELETKGGHNSEDWFHHERRAIDNFTRHLQVCLQRNGGHLEHML